MSLGRPIRRLGIVNRGEAALRCIRAVKALRAVEGRPLEAVALYTDVDRDAPFVRHADLALPLPARFGPVAAYLDHDGLLETLARAGADAVWPGWGFVAEDPVFADRVAEAGLVFLGPPGDVMRALGDKIAAKRLAEQAGVPVAEWSGEAVAHEEAALKHAQRIGLPLVVKASAGGGGRGIRVVERLEGLGAAVRSAAAEARAAFGDDRLFLERKIHGGRHVELQLAADLHGRVLALGARDCSVQRRHQKLIEEAPPPDLSPLLLAAMEGAALELARRVGYRGVGTVEFLVEGERFYFLEMNPRLQVEHGITEETTGLDLVQLQIRIARGERLPEQPPPVRGVAIEARVCAEDAEQGFLPAPGRIARFDPALGPRVRVDAGVAAGSRVPAEFDSLVAKVIATGETRGEALARLACSLRDFELVIEGGASNKGLLIDVLESPALRAGAVDTNWFDGFVAEAPAATEYAAEALIAAAILTYQRRRHVARANFYADTANVSPGKVLPSVGQQIDLSWRGTAYRLQVFAVGSWRYRVHLDGCVVSATLREEGPHMARLLLRGRTLRVLHDASDTGLRLEVEGRPHRFGWQGAGEVRAGTPAMVVAVQVARGDRVEAGQPLGLLEAMKMEIGFSAPVGGVVAEVCAQRGQQVAAGDLLLVIDPAQGAATGPSTSARLRLETEPDPLAPLFGAGPDGTLGEPDLAGLAGLGAEERRAAIGAVREEIRRVLLGYDADAERGRKLVAFLEAPLPAQLAPELLSELGEIRGELVTFADVEQLFIRTPRASVSGELGPSNNARLRMYVRRMRASGAGIAEEFLVLLREALAHYGIGELQHSDALERAVLRLFASQRSPELRRRLVLGLLRQTVALAEAGLAPGEDATLQRMLERIAAMRGLVSDALADGAIEAGDALFRLPELERDAARARREVEAWLAAAEETPTAPPGDVLAHLAAAPREVFDRVGRWLSDPDPRRRGIALSAHLRRLYGGVVPRRHASSRRAIFAIDRLELPDGRVVFGTTAEPVALQAAAEALLGAAAAEAPRGGRGPALDLLVPGVEAAARARLVAALSPILPGRLPAERLTLGFLDGEGEAFHHSFVSGGEGPHELGGLHGLHPELAARVDLDRLVGFDLRRLEGSDGVVSFHGRSREIPGDERIFVLADVRGRSPAERDASALEIAAFERTFHEATRTLRGILSERDPRRRLQWNRISLFVSPAVQIGPEVVERLARRLAPATRHLGLEKVVVRLEVTGEQGGPPRPVEIVISDPTGSRMELLWREPHHDPLRPASAYERKVVEARRRRLVYPYEVVRMLTGPGSGSLRQPSGAADLPAGTFEEWDLDPASPAPLAHCVDGRPPGSNRSSVVFGILSTPTETVPEGVRRILILSDPTLGMGSLAAAECDRLVAAIDLAERLGLPVEWVPISSGAKIALDSGTENLDATARVVRRIVTFTEAGGTIHLIVHGVNVGAQSYFDALATMLTHTRGVLVMTPGGSMVLTGRAALEASGGVAAEDEVGIGGYEQIMGPNGEAQYYARDLADAFRVLQRHYDYTYVVPGESGPRRRASSDPAERSIVDFPYDKENGEEFRSVGEIFDAARNEGRKRPFSMRAVMRAVIDQDGGHLERWRGWVGAETAIVWDARLGGASVCLLGIESRNLPREGYRPLDGPSSWSGGTLFPLSSKKIARALNAASGNRPVVVLANLSGFDGSPESMRKLQLEYGAEIARAVVHFQGPLVFLVVSRYHGGAYVVFSRALNPQLRAGAVAGSYASVIGGGPAAAVVFAREVRERAARDPRLARRRLSLGPHPSAEERAAYEQAFQERLLETQAELAAEFDAVHTVERARVVGSLEEILPASAIRPWLVRHVIGD